MHAAVFHVLVSWLVALVAVLGVWALRRERVVERTLALDTLALVFVALLGLLAVHDREEGYLDIALVIAMLGFVQTVATARLLARRRRGRG